MIVGNRWIQCLPLILGQMLDAVVARLERNELCMSAIDHAVGATPAEWGENNPCRFGCPSRGGKECRQNLIAIRQISGRCEVRPKLRSNLCKPLVEKLEERLELLAVQSVSMLDAIATLEIGRLRRSGCRNENE